MLRSLLTLLTLCLALQAGADRMRPAIEDFADSSGADPSGAAAPAIFRGHAGGSHSITIEPQRDAGVGSHATCQDSTECAVTLTIDGHIDASMVTKVRQALAARAGDGPVTVALDSLGGDLWTALQIGHLLRAARASVSVAPSAICASACTFILAAGTQRSVMGKVGIHRPKPVTPSSDSEAALSPRVVTTLHAYAAEMNVSDRWIDDMLAVPPESVKWLTQNDLERYGMGS